MDSLGVTGVVRCSVGSMDIEEKDGSAAWRPFHSRWRKKERGDVSPTPITTKKLPRHAICAQRTNFDPIGTRFRRPTLVLKAYGLLLAVLRSFWSCVCVPIGEARRCQFLRTASERLSYPKTCFIDDQYITFKSWHAPQCMSIRELRSKVKLKEVKDKQRLRMLSSVVYLSVHCSLSKV